MKAMFSETYYRKNWDRFIAKVPGDDYINMEDELSWRMANYEKDETVKPFLWAIKKVEAKKIVERCEKMVRREMQTIKDIEAGRSSFGYTTSTQKVNAMFEYRTRFEFNCLQLADFKKKYLAE